MIDRRCDTLDILNESFVWCNAMTPGFFLKRVKLVYRDFKGFYTVIYYDNKDDNNAIMNPGFLHGVIHRGV